MRDEPSLSSSHFRISRSATGVIRHSKKTRLTKKRLEKPGLIGPQPAMARQQPRTKMRPLLIFLVLSCYATSIFALASSTQRTVLVTGGAGYIGSHTCLELLNIPNEQYKVIVADNLDNSSEESLERVKALTGCDPKRLQFRKCDLRDKEGLKQGEPENSRFTFAHHLKFTHS
jgi:hypothetical protein